MNGSGYIKLWRDIKGHWIWQDPEKLRAWLDLLIRANYHDTKIVKGLRMIAVSRGQVFTSQKALATAWNWDRKTVRGFLDLLRADKMVDFATDTSGATGYTLVTICNYEEWQGNGNSKADTQTDTQTDTRSPLDPHSIPTSKKVKKEKKEPTTLSALAAPDTKAAASTTQEPAKGSDWGTPEALVALYHELIPAGHPRVTLPLSPARVAKAKDYLKRFPARDFWLKSFGMVRQSSFLQGKVSTSDRRRFRGDFDWFLQRGKDGTENCLKAFEGKYLDEKSAEPEYLVTWGPCAACGKFHKTSAALKGVCQKAEEEVAAAVLRARAEHLRLVPASPARS